MLPILLREPETTIDPFEGMVFHHLKLAGQELSLAHWIYLILVDNIHGIKMIKPYLGGGFKYFLFSPLLGEDSHFD